MKTTEIKTVIIEKKDIQPLIDKAVAGVSGTKAVSISFRHFGMVGEGRYPNPEDAAAQAELQVSVVVEKEV